MEYKRIKKQFETLTLAVFALLTIGFSALGYAQDEELLEPEKAFAFSAKRTADDVVSLSWNIADGYYMYLDKFKFEANGAALGEPEYPKGKTKFDDFFGEVTTYENKVVIKLPIAGDYTGETFSITAWGQGCNEPIGVCYPPLPNTIEFNTPLAAIPAKQVVAQVDQNETAPGVVAEIAAGEQADAVSTGSAETENETPEQNAELTETETETTVDQAQIDVALQPLDDELAANENRVREQLPASSPVVDAVNENTAELAVEPLMEPVVESVAEPLIEPAMEPGLDATAQFAKTTPAMDSSVNELRGLLGNLGADQQEFLDVDQAFRLDVSTNADNDVIAHFDVEPGYYLYQNSLKFETTDDAMSVGRYSLPPGEPKTDEHFGDVIVYYGSFDVRVPVEGELSDLLNMKVSYQGCAEKGICYAPVEKDFQLAMLAPSTTEHLAVAESVDENIELADAVSNDVEAEQKETEEDADTETQATVAAVEQTKSETNQAEVRWTDEVKPNSAAKEKIEVASQELVADAKSPTTKTESGIVIDIKETRSVFDFWSHFKGYEFNQAFFGLLLAAFGTGLLLTFTPCVLPMIPIVSSIVVGQGGGKARGGWLSLIYVLGTAITYGVIGWVAGATGEQLQAYFQNIYAIGAISVLFVVMALSMFGLFEIQMPSFIQSRMQEKTAGMGGSTFMVFLLGIVSALIVGACVSPLLISVLSVALVKGDPVLGASMMFIMALGMGVVLVLVGVGSSWLLPKAGVWMDYVKYAFGVMLIAVAIYLLGAIPAVPVQLLWSALFIVLSVYLGATQSLPEGANGWHHFAKGVGIILLVWGVIGLLGGLQGSRDIMHPIPDNMFAGGVASTNVEQNASVEHAEFVRVKNLDELNTLREQAIAESKPLFLDYYADWCIDCVRMEETTFKDAGVIKALENYVLIQVDVTDPKDEDGKALKSEFNIYGPPATVIFDKQGEELGGEFRFYGYRNVSELLALLDKV